MNEALLKELKRLAAEEGTTLTALLERAVQQMLVHRRQPRVRRRVDLPTFAGKGLRTGVDLDDAAALLELMERDE